MDCADLNDRISRSRWDMFWLPAGTTIVDRPELLYTCCPGGPGYLNSCVRVRGDESQLTALVAEVAAAHAGESQFTVALGPDTPELEVTLAQAGYTLGIRHATCAIAVTDAAAGSAAPAWNVRAVQTQAQLSHALDTMDQAFGRSPAAAADADAEAWQLDQCTRANRRVHRFVAYDAHDEPVATGAMTAYPDLELAFLWGGGTLPCAQGRGAYRSVVAARMKRARKLGLKWLGVYARESTSAPILSRIGFTTVGRMNRWDR